MNLLTNMGIGKRLGIGFTAILAATLLTTAVGVARLQDVTRATEAMTSEPLTKERLVSDFHTLIFGSVRRTTAIVRSSDPELASFFKDEAAWSMKQGDVIMKQLVPLLTVDEEQARYQLAMAKREAYNAARDWSGPHPRWRG